MTDIKEKLKEILGFITLLDSSPTDQAIKKYMLWLASTLRETLEEKADIYKLMLVGVKRNGQLKKECEQHTNEVEKLLAERLEFQSENEKLKADWKELADSTSHVDLKLVEENEKLKAEIHILKEANIWSLKQENEKLKDKAKKNVEILSKAIDDISKDNITLNAENEKLKAEVKSTEKYWRFQRDATIEKARRHSEENQRLREALEALERVAIHWPNSDLGIKPADFIRAALGEKDD